MDSETKLSYTFTGGCPGNLWTWILVTAPLLSWASSSLLQAPVSSYVELRGSAQWSRSSPPALNLPFSVLQLSEGVIDVEILEE